MLRCNGLIWPSGAEFCYSCRKPRDSEQFLFRCKNCFGDQLLCADCVVATHGTNPLHRIEVSRLFIGVPTSNTDLGPQRWDSGCFVPSSLCTLRLRVQLGHPPGECCSEPLALHSSHFVVLHTNGIHEVAVDACDCERRLWAGPPEDQLLRAGWFPATDHRPRTCATIEMLDHFLLQTYQAKTTMYDYYSVLEKTTNNVGIKPPNRYHAFLRMVREYLHLLMLKRAGHGHAISGVMGTQQGELAV